MKHSTAIEALSRDSRLKIISNFGLFGFNYSFYSAQEAVSPDMFDCGNPNDSLC